MESMGSTGEEASGVEDALSRLDGLRAAAEGAHAIADAYDAILLAAAADVVVARQVPVGPLARRLGVTARALRNAVSQRRAPC